MLKPSAINKLFYKKYNLNVKDAGVFKRKEQGKAAFMRFIKSLNDL